MTANLLSLLLMTLFFLLICYLCCWSFNYPPDSFAPRLPSDPLNYPLILYLLDSLLLVVSYTPNYMIFLLWLNIALKSINSLQIHDGAPSIMPSSHLNILVVSLNIPSILEQFLIHQVKLESHKVCVVEEMLVALFCDRLLNVAVECGRDCCELRVVSVFVGNHVGDGFQEVDRV